MDNQPSEFITLLQSNHDCDSHTGELTFLLGKDLHGYPVYKNLNDISHMVIAGATGTGKSTLAHAILLSLINNYSREKLSLILCDSKSIEFTGYNNIQHLIIPVASIPDKIQGSILWLHAEINRRFTLISNTGCRTIDNYNKNCLSSDASALPHILLVIDDPAYSNFDKVTWDTLRWITCNGHAAGIHLLLITQAPGNKQLADIIKSGIPGRAVFNIFTNDEEKLLLSSAKNEQLSDVGEIIFCDMPSGTKERIQCYPISDSDIFTVLSNFKNEEHIPDTPPATSTSLSSEVGGDELLPVALDIVLETGQASVSMLQRRLKLGYARSARIIDEMEAKGYIGPFQGSKPRAILISKEETNTESAVPSIDVPSVDAPFIDELSMTKPSIVTPSIVVPSDPEPKPKEKAMIYCKYCYRMLKEGDKFCSACGKEQTDSSKSPFRIPPIEVEPEEKEVPIPSIHCPKCGSEDVSLQLRSAGSTSTTDYHQFGDYYKIGSRTRTSKQNYKSVALCQHCGHLWEPDAVEAPPKKSRPFWKRLLLVIVVISLLKSCGSAGDEKTIWAESYTPLSSFEYYIDSDTLHLKKYVGDEKNVFIAPYYEVHGKQMPVISMDGVFAIKNVTSVIVSEGIQEIANNAFNSCGVEYLYLPSTLSDFDGWNYFHDMKELHFGGTETRWKQLCKEERSNLDVVEIICNSNILNILQSNK